MCICAAPRTPLEGVSVYGHPTAKDFQQLEQFFDDRGVIVTYSNVEEDAASLDRMVALSGQQQAVVTEIGKKIFVGFAAAEIEAVLP